MFEVKKAAVIGAGTMGAQIAAHLANVGITTCLLDVPATELTPEEKEKGLGLKDSVVRNRITQQLWERAQKLSPTPLFTADTAKRVTIGNVEDNLAWLKEVDWVVEAVLEKIELKQKVHGQIAAHTRPGTLISTNTSGIPMSVISEGIPKERQKDFLGTHFFNPPRYMRLLEIIPTSETALWLLKDFSAFAERVLGKGVVVCKDTPGFIGNRIGCFDILQTYHLILEEHMTVEEVDVIMSSLVGRPKSAIFRLSDLIGNDLMVQIGKNLKEALPNDDRKKIFDHPKYILEMVNRGWFGEKKGQGFYKRVQVNGDRQIHVLDLEKLDYRPTQKPNLPILDSIKKLPTTAEKIRTLCFSDDRAGRYAWKHLMATLCYTADRLEEVADDIVDIDRALRWGFNWELGPFETWDALGVKQAAERLQKEGLKVPTVVQQLLGSGSAAFYQKKGLKTLYFDFGENSFKAESESQFAIHLPALHQHQKIIKANPGASLIDLGDGVACLEFHSKMNTIGPDQLVLLQEAHQEVEKNFLGLVVGNQGEHFSAGGNLPWFLSRIEKKDWKQFDDDLNLFQQVTAQLRCTKKPTIVAAHGYALGGGCETVMGSDHVVIFAETYMGLPEVSVGLIPGAGGCKEILIRFTEGIPLYEEIKLTEQVYKAWDLIFSRKISTSASQAVSFGYLRDDPKEVELVLNRDWLLGIAKAKVITVSKNYKPSAFREGIPAVGKKGLSVIELQLSKLYSDKKITLHDVEIGRRLAFVMCVGDGSYITPVNEQYILDVERAMFVELGKEPKSMERIQHMLKTGKPLKN